MCGTCVTATVSGLTIEAFGNRSRRDLDAGSEPD
jgi:hypothetical protein